MIRNIQFDSQRLGKLFLDFTKNDGTLYDVIILAGENGCGKTTVLDSIAYFFQKHSLRDIECIAYDINNHFVELFNKNQGIIEKFRADGETKKRAIALNVIDGKDAEYNICLKGFAYSKARSGFKLDSIVSVSTKDIDANNKDFDNDDYSDIKQLLVDIDTIDSRNFHLFSQSHPSLTGKEMNTEFDKVSRLSRFKSAFNSFFDTIKFDKIGDPINNSFPILFTKHNKSVDINNLSTGEKQIVCRGGRLLKNVGKMDDAVVLIDEPELSLHPSWQRKVLDYYCDLFKRDNKPIAQLIIATHSEYVIESALKKDNCLVIILKDNEGVIEAERITAPDILGDISFSEINYKAFNIYSVDYHNALYSFYQQKIGTENSIERTDENIFKSKLFNNQKHLKMDTYKKSTYKTLPTYIRNAIHHPDSNRAYSYDELKESTELLRKLCRT